MYSTLLTSTEYYISIDISLLVFCNSDDHLCDVQPFVNIVPGCIMGGEKKKSEKARYVYLCTLTG